MRSQQLDLGGLGDGIGVLLDGVRPVRRRRGERDGANPATASTRRSRGGLAAATKPGSDRSAV